MIEPPLSRDAFAPLRGAEFIVLTTYRLDCLDEAGVPAVDQIDLAGEEIDLDAQALKDADETLL